jgi:hypothetical protein
MCQCVNCESSELDSYAAGISHVNYRDRRPRVTDLTSYVTGTCIRLCKGRYQKVWRPTRGARTSRVLASKAWVLKEAEFWCQWHGGSKKQEILTM